jgi:Ca2+:H+ antiporter
MIVKGMLKKIFHWTVVSPILAWTFYMMGLNEYGVFVQSIGAFLLILSVLSAVHHSEVVAHRVGEPFGTIILAVAITIIEVALIVSLMIAGGESAVTLARDTVFAAVMLILNGIIGACLLIGSYKHHEQYFARAAVNTALVSLVAILVLTLILPNYTTSISGPKYTPIQLMFAAFASLVIYGSFLLIQTVRHREYFLTEDDEKDPDAVSVHHDNKKVIISLVLLCACLGIVVLLAKSLSPTIESILQKAELPNSLVGVIIATIVLLPEGIAAINAALKNKLQTSLNLALGSALASIGLTIPAVALVSNLFDLNVVLGLDMKSMVLLALSVFTVMLSLSKGKTNILYGSVLLVNLAAYIFITIFP